MASKRRKQLEQLALAGLAVVLTVMLYRAWTGTSVVPLSSSNDGGRAEAGPNRRPTIAAVATPDVHLKSLQEERAKPTEVGRNLFRFKTKPAPPPPLPPAVAVARPVAPPQPIRQDTPQFPTRMV